MNKLPSQGPELDKQLQRQSIWLRESLFWLLKTKGLGDYVDVVKKPTALDVGCGPGITMKLLEREFEVQGIDIDPRMVKACLTKEPNGKEAAAGDLPFDDGRLDSV